MRQAILDSPGLMPSWRASDTNCTAPPNGHEGVPGYHAGDAHPDTDPEPGHQRRNDAPERPLGPAPPRPADLGHGPVQLPLHLLHAEGDLRARLPVPPARP